MNICAERSVRQNGPRHTEEIFEIWQCWEVAQATCDHILLEVCTQRTACVPTSSAEHEAAPTDFCCQLYICLAYFTSHHSNVTVSTLSLTFLEIWGWSNGTISKHFQKQLQQIKIYRLLPVCLPGVLWWRHSVVSYLLTSFNTFLTVCMSNIPNTAEWISWLAQNQNLHQGSTSKFVDPPIQYWYGPALRSIPVKPDTW